jgi:8-oxo-dGTP pyrophosphatase MutT (NUDIX family)
MRTPLQVLGFRSAAVLVPLLHTQQGWQVLFTVRARHLRHHPGQIAFPGGKLEPHEAIYRAALRECAEEVGLELPLHCVLGLLDDQISPSGYVVTPVVAACCGAEHALASLALQPSEVDDAFTVPLAELTALIPRQEARSVRGFTRILHDYRWQQRRIWGLTGNVLADMLEVLTASSLVDGAADRAADGAVDRAANGTFAATSQATWLERKPSLPKHPLDNHPNDTLNQRDANPARTVPTLPDRRVP